MHGLARPTLTSRRPPIPHRRAQAARREATVRPFAALVCLALLAACNKLDGAGSANGKASSAPPAVSSSQSELVTSPATWTPLWGSWPQAHALHAAAYDGDRKVMVVYGGQSAVGSSAVYYGDTWEWNGTRGAWSQRISTKSSPGERSGHAMVYDPVNKKMFLFGGWQEAAGLYFQDMWDWDATASTWTKRATTGTVPWPRHDHSMLYDPDRQKIVLFGGMGIDPQDVSQTPQRLKDLWELDVTTGTWAQVTVSGTSPAPRHSQVMTYDSARKRFVMKGGNVGTGAGSFVNETWEYDPALKTWQTFTGTALNTGYANYIGYERIAFDPGTSKTYLCSASTGYFYVWDPTMPAWTKATPTLAGTTQPNCYYSSFLYDSGRQRLVLFGGNGSRALWELDTSDLSWKDRSAPVYGPIQRSGPAVAFDTKRGKLRVFGGYSTADSLYKQDIWEWSGSDAGFTNQTSAGTKPAPRRDSAMVYDSKRDRLVLYGGYGSTYFDDLWAWDPTAQEWSALSVSGVRPGTMYGHKMFYDASRDKVLLFSNYSVVWEYDCATSTWKNRAPTTTPTVLSGRSYYNFAFDSDRGKIFLVGGYDGAKYTSDVVEWDVNTGTWTLTPPATGNVAPAGRYYHAVTYDPGRRVLLLTAGYVPITGVTADVNDSWEWNPLTSTWSETTPTGVKPLPRENPLLVNDTLRGTTYLFGGSSVPGDTTYGPQEIWEYAPNAGPRPNGAGCSAASASGCQSGNCVDGVCCAQSAAMCAAMCQACNVPGKLGTCSAVPAGSPDDTCPGDQVCDANQKCKARLGAACVVATDCGSGFCVDGVCCNSLCGDTCKSCNVTGSLGTCTNTPAGDEDPNGAPVCQSSAEQGRFCDGNGVCSNTPKANGKTCTASGQCASAHCIDGVCCNTGCAQTCYACNRQGYLGTCTAIETGLPDHSATTTCDGAMQYCAGGACASNKKTNGGICTAATDCGSGYCVDGRCCNSTCLGTCQACNVAGQEGKCVNVVAGATDSNATTACALPEYCDAAGTCQSGKKANGLACATAAECGSGFCADGVCCNAGCKGACMACNLTGDGTCVGVATGATDLASDTPCAAPNYCTADHLCTTGKKPNGAVCGSDLECGSNACVDGTCCETACVGTCRSCKNATGTCTVATEGQDPRGDCKGQGVCGGTCDGRGACRYAPEGLACSQAGCQSDGYIRDAGKCDGAGYCNAPQTKDCSGFACYTDPADSTAKCKTSCTQDPDCASKSYCNESQCPKAFDLGHACTRNAQCLSGTCSDGVCCNVNCDQCGSCNMPGKEGTCVPIPAGTDPEGECLNSASDPTGKCGGFCNGKARCTFPAAGSTCGTCKTCDGSGKCSLMPEDDTTCGDIDCDGLDTSCADYRDIKVKRCATLGACKPANALGTCTDVTMSCPADGGAGGAPGTGGTSGTGGAGGAPGKDAGVDASGTTPDGGKTDGATGGSSGGGGGGCGCDMTGTGLTTLGPSFALGLIGLVSTRRRRREQRGGGKPRDPASA